MSAQDKTLQQYHEWMQTNAAAHLIRAGRELRIYDVLSQRQHTLEELCETLSLRAEKAKLLLDALVVIGVVEQYEEDYALSQGARLLCQYDRDLADQQWGRLVQHVQGETEGSPADDQPYFDQLAATQWIHTPAAIQAAELLDLGGDDGDSAGLSVLDLGCGSAVWSCAMAHRDSLAQLTLVDHHGEIQAALATAKSIEIENRVTAIEGDFRQVTLAADTYELVLLAQRLGGLGDDEAGELLGRAVAATKPGGRLVVIDLFRGPTKPGLSECVQALRLSLGTTGGRMRDLKQAQTMLVEAGLENVQFSFLAASRDGLGLAVGIKPAAAPES